VIRDRKRVVVWVIASLLAFVLHAALRSRLAFRDPIASLLVGDGDGSSTLVLVGLALVVRLLLLFVLPGWGILVIGSVVWDRLRPPSGKELGDAGRPVGLRREVAADDRSD
jgi:hypothetical protein